MSDDSQPKPLRIQDSQLATAHSKITGAVNKLRRCLEVATIEKHGEISVVSAAAISTACRAEKAARVVGTLLRKNVKILDPMKQAELQEKIVKLSERRDAAIGRLKIESKTTGKSPWDGLDLTLAKEAPENDD